MTQTEVPEVKSGVEFLTDEAVVSPVLAYDNLSVWYFNKSDGELRRQHLKNRDDLKSYPLPDHRPVSFAVWPSSGSSFIMGTSEGLFLYDSEANEFIKYAPEIKFIDWIIGGQRVAYVWADRNGSFLSAARADNKEHEVIAKLPTGSFRVAISPNGKSFMLYSSAEAKPVYFVTQGLGVLETVAENIQVLRGKFSADGRTFAYVTSNLDLYTLDVATKENVKRGTVSAPESFAWSGDNLYWADKMTILHKFYTADRASENITDKVPQSRGLLVSHLLAGTAENEIFFVEQGSGRLGRIGF